LVVGGGGLGKHLLLTSPRGVNLSRKCTSFKKSHFEGRKGTAAGVDRWCARRKRRRDKQFRCGCKPSVRRRGEGKQPDPNKEGSWKSHIVKGAMHFSWGERRKLLLTLFW